MERSLTECVILLALGALLGSSGLHHKLFGDSNDHDSSPLNAAVSGRQSVHSQAPQSLTYLDEAVTCPKHALEVHVLSQAPLVVYMPNFLTGSEISELIDLAYVHELP